VEQACERFDFPLVSRPSALCQRPHAFDSCEQRISAALSQRLAQQLAEHPHIVAQWLVRVGHYRKRKTFIDVRTRPVMLTKPKLA
jgi:hypothetical protein